MCYHLIHLPFVCGKFFLHPLPDLLRVTQRLCASPSAGNQTKTVIIRCDLHSFNLKQSRIKMLRRKLREDPMRNICLFDLRIFLVGRRHPHH
jgi:hypothetical protein